MKFETPLIPGTLLRRYQRFLADVVLDDGAGTTVHCANTGAMLGCQQPGSRVWLSRASNPARKYPLSWELVETAPGVLVGINTARTNRLVEEGLIAGSVDLGAPVRSLRREVTHDRHRFDFAVELSDGARWTVEVKNVTAAVERGVALFPDAVSTRGASHVRTLAAMAGAGKKCALIYCVQREDVHAVRPASEIDPDYAAAVSAAAEAGVHIAAYGCSVTPAAVAISRRLAVR